jgi:DNA-binding MarR family transcriptional regulator
MMSAATEVATAQRLRLAIVRLTRSLRRFDAHLTQGQLAALATVADYGPLRLSEVAQREQVAASVATRVIASIEELGLVTRVSDPDDGRASLISLTKAGWTTIQDVRSERTAGLEARLQRLTPDERARIVSALDALERLGKEED